MDLIKELLPKVNKKNLSNKDCELLSEFIVSNIDKIEIKDDKVVISDGSNHIPLGFVEYNIINGCLKGLSQRAKDIILSKIKNPNYNQSDDDEKKEKDLTELLNLMGKYEEYYGPVMANKQYREEIVNITLRKKFPTFKRQDKKIDFVVPELGLSCGETKTAKCSIKDGKISNCKFEFDKQNDPARQENTLKSDAFVFAGINSDNPSDSEILFYIFVHNKEEVSSVIKLLRTKQEDFNIVLEQIKKENKQLPRDTIQVELKDLIELGLPVYDANHNKIIN